MSSTALPSTPVTLCIAGERMEFVVTADLTVCNTQGRQVISLTTKCGVRLSAKDLLHACLRKIQEN